MRRFAIVALGVLLASALVACGSAKPQPAQLPDAPRLGDPRSAVESYLDWVSYAYRIADAEPAARTMTAAELVRVDAYIQRNRRENRGIDQELVSFEQRSLTSGETTAQLGASESWRYRYISLEPLDYTSEMNEVSYETTYTLVRTASGWLVDDIQVEPIGEIE